MKRIVIAVLAFVCLLGACSNERDERSDGTASTSTAETPDETTSTSAAETPDDTTSTSVAETPEGTSTLTGEELLIDEGLLVDGEVMLGPVAPDDQAVNHAICDYVFGTPADVASLARVDGDLALTDNSGYQQFGGGGSGPRCVYTVDGQEAFGLWLWTDEVEVEDPDTIVAQVEVGPYEFGLVALHPDWDGELGVDAKAGARWLEDAGTRYGGASV